MRRHQTESGFTLLEMSIVIVIIGLISAMSIFFGMGALDSAKRTQTENKMRLIEQTLQAYREQYDRLPCPTDATITDSSSNYGTEASNPGSCTGGAIVANYSTAGGIVEGALPFATLNLPAADMYDGWGRKFAYAVDSNATAPLAFQTISVGDICGITINDASENPRPGGAIYALVSFGEDGHGGYLSTGTRYSAGATNLDEKANCHCDSNANDTGYTATYVQKDPAQVSPTNQFFDLVRFKQRWQMQDYEDYNKLVYTGPQLMAGYQLPAGNSNSAYAYRLQCGQLKKQADLNPVATESATGVVFLPSNSAILVFSKLGCELYTITNGSVDAGSGVAVQSCPAYDTSVKVALSSNGYLAMTESGSPYVLLWQQSGNAFNSIASPSSPTPSSRPDSISISPDYLVLSSNAGNYMTVYGRNKNVFTGASIQPSGIPANPYSSSVSPNEMYVGATTNASPPQLYLWHINASSFTALTVINISGTTDNPAGLTFSPDGRYIALGGTSGDNIGIFKIDANDTITQLAAPTGWTSASSTAGTGFAFVQDSSYIAMLTPSTAKPLVLFRWMSPIQYQYATLPDLAPARAGLSAAFSY